MRSVEERFEVLSGEVRTFIDREERTLKVGRMMRSTSPRRWKVQ